MSHPTATERYHTDPKFSRLVDVLHSYIANAEFTPTELREAVILAATMYEYRTARPLIYGPEMDRMFWTQVPKPNDPRKA